MGQNLNKQKVLFIGPFPPPYGGIANQANMLFNSHLNKYFDLVRLNLNLPSEKVEIVSEKRNVNIKKVVIGLKNLMVLLMSHQPKVIYMEMNGSIGCFREILFMIIIRLFSSAKIALHFHGAFKRYRRNFPFITAQKHNILNRIIINFGFVLPQKIIFCSEQILDDFRSVLCSKITARSSVLENFVDAMKFDFAGNRLVREKTNILFVGRLSKEKGFFDIIHAVPNIVSRHPTVVFHFCGSPERQNALDEIKGELEELSNNGYIRTYSFLTEAQKRLLFSNADVLIFPSYNELFPVVILEGFAQGLPVITTKVGVIPTLVEEPTNGLFVEVGNHVSLQNKILYLLDNPELQRKMSAANRKKALERFDISIAVSKLRTIFEQLSTQ